MNIIKIKNIVKFEIIPITQVNIEVLHICNLKYCIPKEITVISHNGCNYDLTISYYDDQLPTHSFPIGPIKTKSDFIVRPVETSSGK